MQGEKSSRAPFDDRAALEELERLQRSIQEYRRRREEAEGAFEQFVGSFKKPAAVADDAGPAPTAPLPGFYTQSVAPVSAPAGLRGAGPPLTVAAPPPAVEPPIVEAPPVLEARPPARTPVPLSPAPEAAPPKRPVSAPAPQIAQRAESAPPTRSPYEAAPPEMVDIPVPDTGTAQVSTIAGSVRENESAGSDVIVTPPTPRAWTPADQVEPESGPAPDVSLPDNFFSSGTGRSYGDNPSAGVPEAQAARGRGFPRWIPLAFVGTAAVLVAAVFLMISGQAPAAPDAVSAPATVETPAAAPPPAPTAAAPAAVPSPPPPAEIRTLRSVWVRVTVDGRREVERELEADARIPLPAGRSFVIRAGDAGAVHFLLNGQDQGALGRDAQVVTRTFTAAAQ